MTTLDAALRQFEATEANLVKLEKLWEQISRLQPSGPAFGGPPEYEELCLAFRRVLPSLPAIDGFRVSDQLFDYDTAGQMHLDALEVDEISAQISVSNALDEQGRVLREYRFRLQTKRRELIRGRVFQLIDEVDKSIHNLDLAITRQENDLHASPPGWSRAKQAIAEIDTLLGGSARPKGWPDLQQHVTRDVTSALLTAVKTDWPLVKSSLQADLYGEHDPVPVDVLDLGEMVASRPQGPVPTKLNWSVLSDEDFERLIFLLISDAPGYENPQWLQDTRAQDRGRDLSVTRREEDPLAGVRRFRVIIQCKNWRKRSIAPPDITTTRDQMDLWQPPRVDTLIFATTGKFTADAISLVEKHNQSDRALHIEMWNDSHLERLLASRPHLVGQFRLRSLHNAP